MAKITLQNLAHSYKPNPTDQEDWALQEMTLEWEDGGAYALLGPSGCGKTTLLNIISGLLTPSKGAVLFDDKDVTALSPEQRNIAQVFQFPVVYDTMSVYDNLAFPLKNRDLDQATIDQRVREVAQMLELEDDLTNKAAGLTADGKQKISLGRGLVRSDVNVIMFDEPLTVIDPKLKWLLRSKLKELHRRFSFTMIYVTHDQTEALTFADKIVVMEQGKVLQVGSSEDLFEQPEHTFVGHFIGSPGMNRIDVKAKSDGFYAKNLRLPIEKSAQSIDPTKLISIGIRPEHIYFSDQGLEVKVNKIEDVGRYKLANIEFGDTTLKMVLTSEQPIPEKHGYIKFDPDYTHLYINGWRDSDWCAHD